MGGNLGYYKTGLTRIYDYEPMTFMGKRTTGKAARAQCYSLGHGLVLTLLLGIILWAIL